MSAIEERNKQIKKMAETGKMSEKELATAYGLSLTYVYNLLRGVTVERTRGRKNAATPELQADLEIRNQNMRQRIRDGECSRRELAEETGLSYPMVCKITQGCGHSLRGYARVGTSILEGVPEDQLFSRDAADIANQFGVSPQTVYAHRKTRLARKAMERDMDEGHATGSGEASA